MKTVFLILISTAVICFCKTPSMVAWDSTINKARPIAATDSVWKRLPSVILYDSTGLSVYTLHNLDGSTTKIDSVSLVIDQEGKIWIHRFSPKAKPKFYGGFSDSIYSLQKLPSIKALAVDPIAETPSDATTVKGN
jgi:hypothetical protein